jgi:hypothetical protein
MLIKLKIYGTKFIFSCGGIILQKTRCKAGLDAIENFIYISFNLEIK